MNKKQLTHFEKRLLEERARVVKELGHYDESFNSTLQGSDGDLSSYSFHMADQGTDAMEREKQFLFASQPLDPALLASTRARVLRQHREYSLRSARALDDVDRSPDRSIPRDMSVDRRHDRAQIPYALVAPQDRPARRIRDHHRPRVALS